MFPPVRTRVEYTLGQQIEKLTGRIDDLYVRLEGLQRRVEKLEEPQPMLASWSTLPDRIEELEKWMRKKIPKEK